MKKISLIACAALVAGLLVSCNNETGPVDYNSVRSTKTANSYLVSGTITTVETSETGTFDAENKQTLGSKSKTTDVEYINSAEAFVYYSTDSVWNSNYQDYQIQYKASKGYHSWKDDEEKSWSGSAWVDAPKATEITKGTEATYDIDANSFVIYSVDGVFYFDGNGTYAVVEADEDAIQSGESFSLKVSFTIRDDGAPYSPTPYTQVVDNTSYDDKGKQVTGRTTSNESVTVTYDLKFTAK